ncbi:replication initiation protein, RepL1 [Streptomyces sp. Alain-F2R5]|jgi:DNA-binding MarR family transcriptional regulator|uniref:MarR family transcriptional regulator n=1 Tax=Streptomyces TaxID=1883 RepID=UPI000A25B7CB|nr:MULTISPECIES: helix-turn-helix domain-containing protein [unclassified Streptomyces]MDG9695063.1 helix-turn-helix domain-containing protein [Streptomyces sp. DH17]OSC70572.1 replication initiation protein, RepL1 [Streptomyces sp. 4F]MDN3250484.1 helix-turn-helix domain-containing protein [Streptomyces sp. ZSW22]MDN3257450.1 helix-turn-helix domain-containing protein [Streptomyces sp. MA25(2023)]MDQ0390151.1 DNA-binding MarR family transcriptional regulator [Streptomyces sp. DSM 42143]
MTEQARKILALVDQDTGEFEEVHRASYAFDGAHINVGIRKGRELASAASGLTDREFRVLVWYWFATETSEEAVMRTGSAIAEELGMSADALSRAVKVLKQARLLVEAGGLGRTTFYRCTPYLAFIGTGFAHREAVKDWNPPETKVREPRVRRRGKKGEA